MKYLIAGTGAVGLAVMDDLSKRGHEIILVNRTAAPAQILPASVAYRTLDARDPAALAAACQGCDCLVHTAGTAIDQAAAELPALMDSMLQASIQSGAGLIYIDTMDAYGDNLGIPMSEATPERPTNAYEQLRAELGRKLLQAIAGGQVRAQIARCGTLYGPRVTRSGLGESVFGNVAAGNPAKLLGRLDMPHAFTFVRDLARAVANLSEHDESWGRIWHVPCPQPITQKQVLDILRDVCSRPVTAETINSSFFGLKSLLNPQLKQFADCLYRFEKPYVINHSRFSTSFGERTTAHEQALFETLEWFRQRAGISRRYGF